MVWNLNVQLEAIITTRCFANMSNVACASMVRNQRAMKKRRKQYKKGLVQVRLSTPMSATSLSIVVNYLPTNF
jgi:hypothetical protein